MSIALTCAYCGAPATESDHLTGCDAAGRYFDRGLVVPSCRGCNLRGVECWQVLGLDRGACLDSSELRARRLAIGLERLAGTGRPLTLPAPCVDALATLVDDLAQNRGGAGSP